MYSKHNFRVVIYSLGLSETWLNDKLPNELYNLSNDYTLFRNDRKWAEDGKNEPKKGRGVAVYI